MPDGFDLAVWDFDGVLNANIVDGRFVWSDTMEADLGIDPDRLQDFLFDSGLIQKVIRGKHCLRTVIADWLAAEGHTLAAERFLAYWFAKDALPDPETTFWLRSHAGRKVIGTNNETLRCAYIETEMGFADVIEQLFSSGRMGVAKPEAAFFEHVQSWSGVPPERILLIDDSANNVSAAQALGWQAFHFRDDTRHDLPRVLGLGP